MRQPRKIKTWSVLTGLKTIGIVLILQLQFGLAIDPEKLLELLNKLPEPNFIEQVDIERIIENYKSHNGSSYNLSEDFLDSSLIVYKTQTDDNGALNHLRETEIKTSAPDRAHEPRHLASDEVDVANMYRPTWRTCIGDRWAMSQIAWNDHDNMAFLFEQGIGYEIFVMANNITTNSWRWKAILNKIVETLRRLCDNDIVNCAEQVFKGHFSLSKAYNLALTSGDDQSSFIFTLLLRDSEQRENLLHVRRGIWLKYEPMNSGSLSLSEENAASDEEEAKIFGQTSFVLMRPRSADDVAFLAITTDTWNNVFVTKDIKRYMCQKYQDHVSATTTTSQEEFPTTTLATDIRPTETTSTTPASNFGMMDSFTYEKNLSKSIALDASYWYARRFLIPTSDEQMPTSSSVFIFLLKPLADICRTAVAVVEEATINNENVIGTTTLASLIEASVAK